MQRFPKGLLLEITTSNFGSVNQKTPYLSDNYTFTCCIKQSYCSLPVKVNSKHKFKRKRKGERKGKQIPREHVAGGPESSVTLSQNILLFCRAINFPN